MSESSRLIIKGGRVYDQDSDPHDPPFVDVYIEGADIAVVVEGGTRKPPEGFDGAGIEILDATDKLVVPGFVNAHYHSHDVFLKGFFEPAPLEMWILNALPRSYPNPSKEAVRARTLLGAVECLRSGITTMQDMVTLFPPDPEHVETIVSAYDEIGIRAVLGLQIADTSPLETVPYWREVIPDDLQDELAGPPATEPLPDLVDFVEAEYLKHRKGPSRLTWSLAPSGPERCSRPMLERLAGLSETYGLPVYTHIYISKAEALNARRSFAREDGSLVRYLRDVGLLGPKLSLAHSVWLLPGEIEALAEAGSHVVLNPVSNLKNKNGVAPIRELFEAGINLALGCDNCSCTDTQNMFQAMKMFTLLTAVSDPAPGPPDAVDAMRAATVGGARTAGLESAIGAIRPGMKADLAILDLTEPAFVPLNSAARQLVYGECGASVETVVVDGRIVMRDRRVTTIDEAALREAVGESMAAFRRDAKAVIERNEKLKDYFLEADRRVWTQNVGTHRYVGR